MQAILILIGLTPENFLNEVERPPEELAPNIAQYIKPLEVSANFFYKD